MEMAKLVELRYESLEYYSSYSPDLAPSDFQLFPDNFFDWKAFLYKQCNCHSEEFLTIIRTLQNFESNVVDVLDDFDKN